MKAYFIWLLKVLTILVLLFVVVPAMIAGTISVLASGGEQYANTDKAVAVVELKGEIDDSKDVVAQLYKQIENKQVKAVVLRIDSPGGAVGPAQDIFTAVNALKVKKPIVASMGSLAASGGLYAALGATKIVCQPGTLTGSIGVIMQTPNFSRVAERVGVQFLTVKSGALKDVGNPFRDVTPEEREYLQHTVSIVAEDFMKAVSDSRKIPLDEVRKFADGRVLTGGQAMELKLVDMYGDVYTAAREALALAHEPIGENEIPKLIYPRDKFSQFKQVLAYVKIIPKMLNPVTELRFQMY